MLVLAICVSLLAGTFADPDLWGHVLFGQLTSFLGQLPIVDPYSYASSGKWINHEWLSEVIFGGVYGALGSEGLVLLKTALGVGLFAWIYARLVRAGLDVLRAGAVLLVGGLLFLPFFGVIRPHVFTFVLFGITLALLRSAEAHPRVLWWLVPVVAVWVNLHGGVLAGLGIVAVWSVIFAIQHVREGRRDAEPSDSQWLRGVQPALVCAVAAAATLLNPYGSELPVFLLETATVPRPDITEWQPLRLNSGPGRIYLFVLGLAAYTVWQSKRKLPPSRIAVLVVTAITPLVAARHLPLVGLVVLLLLDDVAAEVWGGTTPNKIQALDGGGWLPRLTGGTLLVVASAVLLRTGQEASCIALKFSDTVQYPVRAVELLDDADVEGNVLTYFDWGEYVIWHLGPEVQVGMDGRRETVYADSTRESYLNFMGGRQDWDRYLQIGPADLVLIPTDRAASNLLELSDGWSRVYRDSVASIFGRSGSSMESIVRSTPVPELPADGAGLCFPGPA